MVEERPWKPGLSCISDETCLPLRLEYGEVEIGKAVRTADGLDHYPESIHAIREITKWHTGEYCIRPFLKQYPGKTLEVMETWSRDGNVHVRKLSSEGLGPRLAWARKLDQFIADPEPVLRILENLKNNESKFMQKSVANNLNDMLIDI